jgi:hypothetical protein
MNSSTLRASLSGSTAADLLHAEEVVGQRATFERLDVMLANLLRQAARRGPVVIADWGQRATATIRLDGLSSEDRAFLEMDFRLEVQESRGAWFLPKDATVKFGWANYPATEATGARFPINATREQSAKVSFHGQPDALAAWSLVAPMFTDLLAPLDTRTATGKPPTLEQAQAQWVGIANMYADLGLDVAALIASVSSGSRWVALTGGEQRALLADLAAAVLSQATDETARRWRARQVQQLLTAFNRKAKKNTPLARQVLTKQLQTLLSGLFAGDWMAFLAYLGETPNEAEEVLTALPTPKLFVGASGQTGRVAEAQGLPVDEVERMLTAYLGETAGASPVDERTAVMREIWSIFDSLHSRQQPGMPSLWGLFDDGETIMRQDNAPDPSAARTAIPARLDNEVKRLWDGATLPRWPERIVSEFHPYKRMAKAFGPALNLWNGVSLTCWYVCEGPMSRTDLPSLAEYHRRDLDALAEMGCPVPPDLFTELAAAEAQLGPVQQLTSGRESRIGDISISVQIGAGTRRDGYEILRDLVTTYRQAWAQRYLDDYLRVRWDSELRTVATEFHRRLAARGKPPTVKQFASFAAESANNWFGGDLAAVFASLGETSPIRTDRIDLLDHEPSVFVANMAETLIAAWNLPPDDPEVYSEWTTKYWELRRLASDALKYLQLHEALGRAPEPKEFGAEKYRWEYFGGQETAWASYTAAVEALRSNPPPGRATVAPPSRTPAPAPSSPSPPPPPQAPAAPPPPPAPPTGSSPPPSQQDPAWLAGPPSPPPPAAEPQQAPEKKPGLLGRFRRR